MNRRQVIAALGLLSCAVSAWADTSPVSVVKVINFACPICRASEVQDSGIVSAVKNSGGRFVYAPLPAEEGDYAKERVYYASRKQGDEVEARVRASLYKGSQDMGLPFQNPIQVIEWLKDDLGEEVGINYVRLLTDTNDKDTSIALGKAAAVAVAGGSQGLPSYILIQQNKPAATLDPSSSGKGSSLLNLREEVIKRISQLTTEQKPTK